MIDVTKVQFASAFNIDKIAVYSTPDDSSAGVPQNISYSIPGSATSTPTVTVHSISNPYGKKCLTSLSWSLDASHWYDQDDTLYYYSVDRMDKAIQMNVICGCSDSTIYFSFTSDYPTTQTVYVQFAVDSIS